MGIIKNSIDFGSGFNIKSQGPIDSRMVVEYISDLTSVWNSDAPAYIGMVVYVKETGDIYVLTGGKNVVDINEYAKDINNWKKQITDLPNMEDYVTDDELITELSSYATNENVSDLSTKVGNVESSLNDTIESLNTTNENVSDLSTKVGNVESSLNNSYYTIEQVNELIGNINSFNILVVDELPETGDSHTIYFVGVDGGVQNDVKNEYIYIDGKWELIGNTRIDLSDCVTDNELNSALSFKQDTLTAGDNITIDGNTISATNTTYTAGDNISIVDNIISADLSSKQDAISNLDEIIRGAKLGTTALQSIPDEYITETELKGKGYSTTGYVDDKVAALVNGAPETLNTLDELAAALNDNKDIISVLTDSIGKKQDAISNLDEIISGANRGATALQSIPEEYATKIFVTNEIANAKLEGGDVDLSGFVERDELKDELKVYVKTDDLSDYVTETELEDKGYLTEHQDLSDYVKTDDLTDYVTETELESKGYLTEHQDLSDYVTKDSLSDYVPDKKLSSPITVAGLSESIGNVSNGKIYTTEYTVEDILRDLLCKEIYPSVSLTTKNPIITFNGINEEVVSKYESIMKIGSVLTLNSLTLSGASISGCYRIGSGFTNGYSTNNDNKKDDSENPPQVDGTSSLTGNYSLTETYSPTSIGTARTVNSSENYKDVKFDSAGSVKIGLGENKITVTATSPSGKYSHPEYPEYYVVSNLGNTNDNNKLSKSDAVNDGTISNKKVEKTITVTGVYPVYVNIDSGSFVNETKEMELTASDTIELDVPSEVESGIHFTFDYPDTHSVKSFKIWSKLEGDFVDYSASYEKVSKTVEKNINGVEYTYNRLVTKENLQGEGKYKITLSKRLDE